MQSPTTPAPQETQLVSLPSPQYESHQPSGRRWSQAFPLPHPFAPSGRDLPLPPLPGPGRG
eukprot:8226117-Pyramimonas_sp.AAC.1